MIKLTEKDEQGNWALKGVKWESLHEGKPISQELWEHLYGALWKLMEYEDTGLDPEKVEELAERNTPKKPDYEGDSYADDGEILYDTWICPCCETRYEVDYDDYEYCPHCGQRIDWGGGADGNDQREIGAVSE